MDVKEFIEQKRQESKEEKRKMSKLMTTPSTNFFEDLRDTSLKDISSSKKNNLLLESGFHNEMTPQKDETEEKDIEEYVSSIKKTKEYLKNKEVLAEEEAVRLRKKKERENVEQISVKNQSTEDEYNISSFWRDYFRAYEAVAKESKEKRTL